MRVEVCFATRARQVLLVIELPDPSTAREAVEASKIGQFFPLFDLSEMPLGIFSVKCADDRRLKNGDRVEIYRPLIIDPMAQRRKRAVEQSQSKTS